LCNQAIGALFAELKNKSQLSEEDITEIKSNWTKTIWKKDKDRIPDRYKPKPPVAPAPLSPPTQPTPSTPLTLAETQQ